MIDIEDEKIREKEARKIWSPEKIIKVATNINNPRDGALFVIEYLTGGRVSEIIGRVQKKDLSIIKRDDKLFLQISNIYTEKNPKHPERELYSPINEEKKLVEILLNYAKKLNDDDILFKMSRQRAWQIIGKIITNNKPKSLTNKFMNANHFLRHCRNTHLHKIYEFDVYDLKEWNEWSSIEPAGSYVKGGEFLKKMSK